MPLNAEREAELSRRLCEQEQADCDKARVIVNDAPDGVTKALLKQWKSYPENRTAAKFVTAPTDRYCVCWIAAELEVRNV